MINEFDPSRCPSIGSQRRTAAAMYSNVEDKEADVLNRGAYSNASPQPDNAQLSRIEDRLIEEMANSKMVCNTVQRQDCAEPNQSIDL